MREVFEVARFVRHDNKMGCHVVEFVQPIALVGYFSSRDSVLLIVFDRVP